MSVAIGSIFLMRKLRLTLSTLLEIIWLKCGKAPVPTYVSVLFSSPLCCLFGWHASHSFSNFITIQWGPHFTDEKADEKGILGLGALSDFPSMTQAEVAKQTLDLGGFTQSLCSPTLLTSTAPPWGAEAVRVLSWGSVGWGHIPPSGRPCVIQSAFIGHLLWAGTVLVPGDTVLKVTVCALKKV